MPQTIRHAAVFLDRDGTLIHDPGFLRDPGDVRLLDGVGHALRRVNEAGLLAIVVTNQSGIARDLLTVDTYFAIEQRLNELLIAEGARLDAHYFCPHLPEITGACECRKPGTLLYRQAAERFGIVLSDSWWVGDRLRDLIPGRTLGGRGILLETGEGTSEATQARAERYAVVPDLPAAVDLILRLVTT